MLTSIIVAAVAGVWTTIGARQARKLYVLLHHDWWDTKVVERKQMLVKKGKREDPDETLRVLRKEWETVKDAQGLALGMSLLMFLMWPVLAPIFALIKDPVPSNEEQKLVNEGLEAEIRRLQRRVDNDE